MELSLQRLGECLRELDDKRELGDYPPPVRAVVERYVQRIEREGEDSGRSLRRLVAEALIHVWRLEVRELLKGEEAREWMVALLVVAQYLEGFTTAGYLDGFEERGQIGRSKVLAYLQDEDWVRGWMEGEERVAEVGNLAAGLGTKRTYSNWLWEGIEWLRRGILRALGSRRQGREAALALPTHYVERRGPLSRLKEKVKEAVREGGWVGLVGLGGVGKSVLLGALVRDEWVRGVFGRRIAVVEAGEGSEELSIVYRAAVGLGERLPLGLGSAGEAAQLIRERLGEERALLVMDDVRDGEDLKGLWGLGSRVVVVVAAKTGEVTFEAGVMGGRQVRLGGMEEEEALELAVEMAGPVGGGEGEWEGEEATALGDLVRVLEGHPLAIEIAAAWASEVGWVEVERVVEERRGRTRLLGYGEERLNAWASLEAAWEWMTEEMREQVRGMGRLPLLAWYDDGVGQAVWGVTQAEAGAAWARMAQWQLVKREGEGRYRVHGLVWDFARKKGEGLGIAARMRADRWAWRYPLREALPGWRWYWVSVPRFLGDEWAWWDFRMPGGMGGKRLMWLSDKMRALWETGAGLHLTASPAEWVVLERRRGQRVMWSWGIGIGMVLLVLPVACYAWSGAVLTVKACISILAAWAGGLAIDVACWLLYLIVTVDQRRAVWWRTRGRSFVEGDDGEV